MIAEPLKAGEVGFGGNVMANEWQDHCTAELRNCLALGKSGEAHWAIKRWQLHEDAQTDPRASGRVIIADFDAAGADLRRYSFFACYLARCNFSGADLSGSDFELSMVRECSFAGANLTRSSFDNADIGENSNFRRVVTGGQISFAVVPGPLPPMMDRHLRTSAETAWAVGDADRNETSLLARVARAALGHGLAIPNIIASAAVVILAFGAVFWFSPLLPDGQPEDRLIASLLVSCRYFVGLSDQFEASFGWWAGLGVFETALGLALLAILIAAISRRFTVL